jgi:hypothetical protein
MIVIRPLILLAALSILTAITTKADEVVKDALKRAGVPPAQVEAQDAWENCTEHAVLKFAPQSEPATIVATAVIAACVPETILYAQIMAEDPIMKKAGVTLAGMQDSIEKASMPELLAKIMAVRASRQ